MNESISAHLLRPQTTYNWRQIKQTTRYITRLLKQLLKHKSSYIKEVLNDCILRHFLVKFGKISATAKFSFERNYFITPRNAFFLGGGEGPSSRSTDQKKRVKTNLPVLFESPFPEKAQQFRRHNFVILCEKIFCWTILLWTYWNWKIRSNLY